MASRELTDKQRQDAETALYRGDPLPSGLAFERGRIRRLTDVEIKTAEQERADEAARAEAFGVVPDAAGTTVILEGGNAV